MFVKCVCHFVRPIRHACNPLGAKALKLQPTTMCRLKLSRVQSTCSYIRFRSLHSRFTWYQTKVLCKPERDTLWFHRICNPGRAGDTLLQQARECFLHFPKLTPGFRPNETYERAMSASNVIFGRYQRDSRVRRAGSARCIPGRGTKSRAINASSRLLSAYKIYQYM